jgi:hypothetical protein
MPSTADSQACLMPPTASASTMQITKAVPISAKRMKPL